MKGYLIFCNLSTGNPAGSSTANQTKTKTMKMTKMQTLEKVAEDQMKAFERAEKLKAPKKTKKAKDWPPVFHLGFGEFMMREQCP